MYLIDSSVWIEFLSDGPLASHLAEYFDNTAHIIVPALIVFEVSRYFLKTMDEDEFFPYLAQMQRQTIIPLSVDLAYRASVLSVQKKLGMADAIILATAQLEEAKLVTLDNDFRGFANCLVIGKK